MVRIFPHLLFLIVGVMVNDVYNSIVKYFNNLANTGYRKQSDVNRLFLYSEIQELLNNDFRGLISEEDYKDISKALYCLYGSTCLIPYPNYFNTKNSKIMHIGNMSELVYRIEKFEKFINTISESVVVPGDNIKVVDDFQLED